GPGGHFSRHKAVDVGNVPSGPENDHPKQHQKGQDLKGPDQEAVKSSRSGKYSMRTEDPVKDDLQDLDIDDQKANINYDMKDPGNRPAHHFILPQSNLRHLFPTKAGVVGAVDLPPKADVSVKPSEVADKDPYPQE